MDLMQRIEARVEKRPDGCWIWTGSLDTAGYGLIRASGTLAKVHRVVALERGVLRDCYSQVLALRSWGHL